MYFMNQVTVCLVNTKQYGSGSTVVVVAVECMQSQTSRADITAKQGSTLHTMNTMFVYHPHWFLSNCHICDFGNCQVCACGRAKADSKHVVMPCQAVSNPESALV